MWGTFKTGGRLEMSGEDAFHFDPNSVCGMEGLGQVPFLENWWLHMFPPWAGHICQELEYHAPHPTTTTVSHLLTLPTQTRRELVYYQTISWPQGWVLQFCPMGTAKFSLEQWRELLPGETLENFGPQCGNYDQLSGASWSALESQFSLSPLRCPNQADLHSVLRLHLLTWLMLLGYFILLLFWPKCYLPLTTQTKFHVSLEISHVQHIPQIFSSWASSKNAHIFSFMHIIHPI